MTWIWVPFSSLHVGNILRHINKFGEWECGTIIEIVPLSEAARQALQTYAPRADINKFVEVHTTDPMHPSFGSVFHTDSMVQILESSDNERLTQSEG